MLQAELKVLGGKFQGKAIPLNTKRFLVGREQDCHLRPNSDSVSRHHCVFIVDDFAVRLRDLGSTNGTRVNGDLIRHEAVLKDGDEIHVGKLHLQLNLRKAAVESGAAPVVPAAVKGVTPSSEFEVAASQPAGETMFEMPVIPAAAETTTNFAADTTILGGGVPGAAPQFGVPAPYPMGIPPMGMPGQGMPAYGMPPGYPSYPQSYGMPPGYPPQGYPPQGYPQQGFGMPGYPAAPAYGYPMGAPAAPAPEPVDQQAVNDAAAAAIPIKLPPPGSTGVREAQAPPKAEGTSAAPTKSEEMPSTSAADIIKNYMQRRTTR